MKHVPLLLAALAGMGAQIWYLQSVGGWTHVGISMLIGTVTQIMIHLVKPPSA